MAESSGFGAWGVGCMVQALGFRLSGLGLRAQGLESGVQGSPPPPLPRSGNCPLPPRLFLLLITGSGSRFRTSVV